MHSAIKEDIMRSTVSPFFVLFSLLATAGCGDDSSGTGGNGGSSGGSTTGSGAATCDPFTNVGQVIQEATDPGPVPAMTGGAIVDGTYALTADVYYAGGVGQDTRKHTLVFADGTIKAVEAKNAGQDIVSAGSYATTGTSSIVLDVACPTAGSLPTTYTATPTTFTMVAPDDPQHVQTWTKQ
jgi:hypothetical protein